MEHVLCKHVNSPLSCFAALISLGLFFGQTAFAGGSCFTEADCDDGLFCTGDVCFPPVGGGTCIHTENTCSDSQFCNGSEICDEARDACEFACLGGTVCTGGSCTCSVPGTCPNGNEGVACDNSVQPPNCGSEVCNENLDECTECSQSSHCTTAPELRCNAATGACVECLNDFDCQQQDGQFCNGEETCNESTGFCEPGTPVQCDFTEFCSELLDDCVECENDTQCNDGLYCNGQEVCNGADFTCRSACLGGGTCQTTTGLCTGGSNPGTRCDALVQPPNCRLCIGGSNAGANCTNASQCPGGACRTYHCNESNDTCVECQNNSDCEGSDFNWCTRDICIFNFCVHEQNSSRCFDAPPTGLDGQFCNGLERCEGGPANPQCNNATGEGCCLWSCLNGGCASAACPPGIPGPCYKCVGGTDAGKYCHPNIPVTTPLLSDGILCTVDTCNEATNQVAHTPNDTVCNDNAVCNGVEICDPDGQDSDLDGCVGGIPVLCGELETFCRNPSCQGAGCTTTPQNVGEACDDDDPCTAVSECSATAKTCTNDSTRSCTGDAQCPARPFRCSNLDKICATSLDCPGGAACGGPGTCKGGVCVEVPQSENSTYRCVRLEWRNVSPAQTPIDGIVSVDLYAVSDGCGLTTTACPPNQQWIIDLTALVEWNEQQLELIPQQFPTIINPQDPCTSQSPCFQCPPGQANWNFSGWDPDCETGDALNFPCGGFPANDGDASYSAVEPSSNGTCSPVPPVCVPTSPSPGTGGLFVTQFKFKALRGGTAELHLAPCAGEKSTTTVSSKAPVPSGLPSNNVVKPYSDSQFALPALIVVNCATDADCEDFNPCTTQSCEDELCVFESVTGSCDNGMFCDGPNDMCVGSLCTGGGNPCASNSERPFCNEAADRCDECVGPEQCVDTVLLGTTFVPNVCTVDSCNELGDCVHDPYDCDDGADCTVDSCSLVAVPPNVEPRCSNVPNQELCETGLFCLARQCVVGQGCVPAHLCVGSDGDPCADKDVCDEDSDTCGGCLMPHVVPVGGRYIRIVPPAQASTPIAFLVEGDCANQNLGCVAKYVQSYCQLGPDDGAICASQEDCERVCLGGANAGSPCEITLDCGVNGTCVGTCRKGELGDAPVFLTAQEWGTFAVGDAEIRPNSVYAVSTECSFPTGDVLSAAARVQTWAWGDTTGDGNINVIDVGTTVDAVKGIWTQATFEGTNLAPCVIDLSVNVIDIGTAVDVLKGAVFNCPVPCP